MANTTTSLEHFDFLQLLHLLGQGSKTGVLTIHRPDVNLQCWLEQGIVKHIQMGSLSGASALAQLMQDPQGRFQFDEGVRHPKPLLNLSIDALAFEALEAMPELPLPFEGPARITSPERVASMTWSLEDERLLKQIEAQKPLLEISEQPGASKLISRLYRLGLLKARKSRTARLTIAMTREVRGVVLVDQLILQRWREDLVRLPQALAIRNDDGKTFSFPLRSGPNLGTSLHIPQDIIMQTGLRAGESVLVKPMV